MKPDCLVSHKARMSVGSRTRPGEGAKGRMQREREDLSLQTFHPTPISPRYCSNEVTLKETFSQLIGSQETGHRRGIHSKSQTKFPVVPLL